SLLSVALSSFVVKHGYYSINTYLIGIAKTQIVLDKGYTLRITFSGAFLSFCTISLKDAPP
ncbi:MAG: hypothetical protein AAGU27_12785, partial [Dehalobacterium sp.]